MARNLSFLIFLASLYLMDFSTAKNTCKTVVNVPGMALKGFVFKKVPVTAPHVCDITCERETICQSYNYVIGEKSCELNTRTKEQGPRISSQMVYAFTWDALVVEVRIWSSLFYIQVFLSEFLVKTHHFPRASVWLLCY